MQPEPVTLTWKAVRNPHNGKVNPHEGTCWDGNVQIGTVSLAAGDPHEIGAWRFSMHAHGRGARSPGNLQRNGAAATKEGAKAGCEAAYRALIDHEPGNREAIHEHIADVRERARLHATGEGLALSEARTREAVKENQEPLKAYLARRSP